MAQHALVLASSGHIEPDPLVPAKTANKTFQPDSSQECIEPKSTCFVPTASAIKEQGSLRQWQHELGVLKEDQPDQSTRQSGQILQSGATVIRWTSGHHLSNP